MNIKITHKWLLDYLDTDASPDEIRKYLSLCGPSVESVIKTGDDYVYDIEVISNRIDYACVIGIAQEAVAILPMFGKKANLKSDPLNSLKFSEIKTTLAENLVVDIKNPDLVSRFAAVIYDGIKITDSPDFIKSRLSKIGIKVINNVVDISNYLMMTFGQPIHMFDYDKIAKHHMIIRESKKGERLLTLDGKEITLPGKDIVIEDGSGKLIDLCGIMGGANSAISAETKRVLLFVQTYKKSNIRKTTMSTGQRTIAATFFEKGLDEERVEATTVAASRLIQKYCHGEPVSRIWDIYPNPYQNQKINISVSKFEDVIGMKIPQKTIEKIFENLGFKIKSNGDSYEVTVPSYRKHDILIEEDLVEEVSRIYGYHNIKSSMPPVAYVDQPKNMEDLFVYQNKIKLFLKHLGLNEVINYSMVSEKSLKDFNLDKNTYLKLSNPISKEIEYLRQEIYPSLYKNIIDNTGKREVLKFFEIGKVYLKKQNDLPDEIYMIGIAVNTDFYDLKGIIEGLFRELNIDKTDFEIKNRDKVFMVEMKLDDLISRSKSFPEYRKINPFAVIKLDRTFTLSPDVTYEKIVEKAKKSELYQKANAVSLFKNRLTVRFFYASTKRNITEEEAKIELSKIDF